MSYSTLRGIEEATTGLAGPIEPMESHCSSCTLAKSVRVINRAQPERTTAVLGRLWLDWWGPFSIQSLEGNANMLTITDEASRRCWVLFGNRRDLHRLFTEFKAQVELETGLKIKACRCDNAPEFRALGATMAPYGIRFEYTSFYWPELNGVPERLNRAIISVTRAMLYSAKLPLKFWQSAADTACYVRNRAPVGPKGMTPMEAYSGKKPDISYLRAWGCLAYAHIPKETRVNKLEPTAVATVFIAYKDTSRQYKLYDPRKEQFIEATAPTFYEDKLLEWEWGIVPGDMVLPWNPWDKVQEPIFIGTREPETEPEIVIPEDTIVVDTGEADTENALAAIFEDHFGVEQAWITEQESAIVPKSLEEALRDPIHGPEWEKATVTEITKLQALGTWTVVDLPEGKKPIGCRLVYALKYTPTGLIERYKARLVGQGFGQKPGEDFLETFSPTIRLESLKLLLAIGAEKDLDILQCDVVSAYPRSKLHARVYVKPNEYLRKFLGIKDPKKVLLLNQALYGLKQSGREWYIEACRGLKTLGFEPLYSEPSIFQNAKNGQLIGLYVDDIVVLGKERQAVQATIDSIGRLWEIKDLGDISVILGLRITRDRAKRTLKIDQNLYIQSLIEKYRLQGTTSVTLPATDREAYSKAKPGEHLADQALYQSAIGALMWLSRGARWEISASVSALSAYCGEPTVRHWNAVLRILRYLKGTAEMGTIFQPSGEHGPNLQGYCDADYAGDIDDRVSRSGVLYLLGGGVIVATSQKQRSTALSTGQSEYMALAEGAKTGQWLSTLLREIHCSQYLSGGLSVPIYSDNTACIALAKDPIGHARTKHIEVRYHYIRELVASKKVILQYISTKDMLADILTKPLPITAFKRCIRGLTAP